MIVNTELILSEKRDNMDVEELRKLALEAEREYSKALREDTFEIPADEENDSLSVKLDNIDAVEFEINENVVLRPKTVPIIDDNRVSSISSKYTVEEPEEVDNYEKKLRQGVPKEVEVSLNVRCSDISGKYIVEEPEDCNNNNKSEEKEEEEEEQKQEQLQNETTKENFVDYYKERDVKPTEIVEDILESSDIKSNKANDQVKYILEELITTEFEYLKSLHFLLRNFLKPIRKIVDKPDYKITNKIYNILKMIHRLGTMFLQEMSAAQLDIQFFGGIFHRFKTLFNLYTNLSRPWNSFMEIMEKPNIEAKIKVIEVDLNEAIGFSRYIVKPIQRISKYELLLNQILKNITPTERNNVCQIEAARDVLHDVLNRCNTIIALNSIKYQRYDEFQSGNFIMRTDLKWREIYKKKRKMIRPIELFLFEKIIIIALDFDGDLLFEDHIFVSNLSSPINQPESTRFTLEDMRHSKLRRAFRLEAPSLQAKEKCLKSIDAVLWNLLKSLKQRQTESLLLDETNSSTKL